jgi:hypothetical protein
MEMKIRRDRQGVCIIIYFVNGLFILNTLLPSVVAYNLFNCEILVKFY